MAALVFSGPVDDPVFCGFVIGLSGPVAVPGMMKLS
jgi:hypothetical protein